MFRVGVIRRLKPCPLFLQERWHTAIVEGFPEQPVLVTAAIISEDTPDGTSQTRVIEHLRNKGVIRELNCSHLFLQEEVR